MKKVKFILFSALILLLLSACQNKEEQIGNIEPINEISKKIEEDVPETNEENTSGFSEDNKQNEEKAFLDTLEHAKSLNYEEVAKKALSKANELSPNDRELRKWIIRAYIHYEMQGNDIPDTLLEDAKKSKEKREGWFAYVRNHYGVTITSNELDEYISNSIENNENTKNIAKGLGMSIEYLNFTYDRDQYEQQLKWDKLIPILKEKYPNEDDLDEQEYLQTINQKFNDELNDYLGVAG